LEKGLSARRHWFGIRRNRIPENEPQLNGPTGLWEEQRVVAFLPVAVKESHIQASIHIAGAKAVGVGLVEQVGIENDDSILLMGHDDGQGTRFT
jgi:hypothetical protein